MPNKPKAGHVKVGFRMPEELMRRAEYVAEQLREQNPGLEADAYDAIRIILTRHLPEVPPGWTPKQPSVAAIRRKKAAKGTS